MRIAHTPGRWSKGSRSSDFSVLAGMSLLPWRIWLRLRRRGCPLGGRWMIPILISYLRGRILRYLDYFSDQIHISCEGMTYCHSQMNTVQHSDKSGPIMLVAITPLRPIRSASRPMGIAVKSTVEYVRKPTRLLAILKIWYAYLQRHRKTPSHSSVAPTDIEYHRFCKAHDCIQHHLVNKARKATVQIEQSPAQS